MSHPYTTWTIFHHFYPPPPSPRSVHVNIFYENIDITRSVMRRTMRKHNIKNSSVPRVYLVTFQYIFRRFRETCVHVYSSPTAPVPLVDKRGVLSYHPLPLNCPRGIWMVPYGYLENCKVPQVRRRISLEMKSKRLNY